MTLKLPLLPKKKIMVVVNHAHEGGVVKKEVNVAAAAGFHGLVYIIRNTTRIIIWKVQ